MGRAEDLFQRLEVEGEPYIDELIETRKSEESFLDFKRSSNNGSTPKLDIGDRNNLSRALSGFANSEGGVVVWGVDCSRDSEFGDVAQAKAPIQNPQRFASLLEGVLSGCTVPAVQGCRSIAIPSQSGGFVATLIPRSNHAPHQVVQDKRYLIRAGSNFEPVPHAVLAGMFGRRPQPVVYANFVLSPMYLTAHAMRIRCGVMLVNAGSVVAEDCFASTLTTSSGGPNVKLNFDITDVSHFHRTSATGADFAMMGTRDFRLAPGAFVTVFNLEVIFHGVPSEGLRLVLTAGCGGAPPFEKILLVEKDDFIANYDYAQQNWMDEKTRAQTNWHSVSCKMIGLRAHWES